MSVSEALAALGGLLTAVDPTPEPQPTRVYPNPADAVVVSDFPSIVLALAPAQDHAWRQEAVGFGRHDYTVMILVFLGLRTTGLAELHARALPWPKAIATTLFTSLTLGGAVEFIGAKDSDTLFTYKLGEIPWGDGQYWGIKILLPVTQKHIQPMTA